MTKRQVDVQLAIHIADLKHQAGESNRNRMIEAKRANLTHLQESMGALFGAHSTFAATILMVDKLTQLGIPPDDPGRKAIADDIDNLVDVIRKETANITATRALLSDPTLIRIVDEIANEIGRIVSGAEVVTLESLSDTMVDRFAELEGLRPKLPMFNKRIEELLSGDDLT